MIKSDLKKVGFKVISAKNYDEAMEKGIEMNPFLIVIDLSISSSAWDISRGFRKKSQTVKIPQVILAEQTFGKDMINAVEYKVEHYLARPYSAQTIIELAREILKNKKKMKTILVVDNEDASLNIIKGNLSYGGYNVITASAAEDAVRLARTEEIDMLITDTAMPGIDGMRLYLDVKKERENIKVIMLTARDGFEDVRYAYSIGVDHYITKPFDPVELLEKVRRTFDIE